MATENPRVWFKSISLENVRSFGEKQTINFTDKDGNAARWNVILGDNGTGKTTVLKGLCFGTGAYWSDSDAFSLQRTHSNISLICTVDENGKEIQLTPFWVEFRVNRFGPTISSVSQTRNSSVENKLLLAAYGAARSSSSLSPSSVQQQNNVQNLFKDNAPLLNPEQWLIEAELAYRKDTDQKDYYELIILILKKLFRNEVEHIQSRQYHYSTYVYFKTHYGDVRLHELSLGYKTLIAWMVDFAKGLLDRYPDSKDPLAEPAVCLVDEIDLHLHPKFQRSIIKFLTETFPNTQFIVTAHSPLIVVAAEERPLDANIILLKREGDQTVVVNDPVDVTNWSVDQILNSDLFGHVPSRAKPLTELRTERDTLLAKPKLTKKDSARLAELDEKIGFVPFGQDQAEIKAETIIQQLADVLRKQQQVQ